MRGFRRGLALLALSIAVSCGNATPNATSPVASNVPHTTIPQTTETTAPPCPDFGSVGRVTGKAAVTRSPAVALLRNVQIQAGQCVDEVAFLFMGGLPGWTAEYRSDLALDPSGRTVELAAPARLVVQFTPSSSVDVASPSGGPTQTYDGPTRIIPAAPSEIAELRQLGDFEAVTTWAVGLPATQPFELIARGEQLVLRIAAPRPRPARCTVPDSGITVGFPSTWYAELSERWVCRYFNPEPFAVYPATDRSDWAVTVGLADEPADRVVTQMAGADATVLSRTTTAASLPATVLDITERGHGLYPDGYVYRMYVVATTPKALLISGTPAAPGAAADRYRDATDFFAAQVLLGR